MARNVNDTCPRCLRRDVEPLVDAEDYHGNPHTSYRCPNCHHVWVTRRTAEPEESRYADPEDIDDPDAWEADDDFSDYEPPW